MNNEIWEFQDTYGPSVIMFAGDQLDIQTVTCYIPTIQDGTKALGISSMDALNLELSETLVEGNEYSLTFWMYANNGADEIVTVELGCTEVDGILGDVIGSDSSVAYLWEEHTITFTAPNNGQYISVRNEGG